MSEQGVVTIIEQTEGYLQKVISQYPTSRTVIEELRAKYMKLSIEGIDDKDGFSLVHDARMDMKKRRVALEKAYKAFNAEAKVFTDGIRTEKNELISLCAPIEEHLEKEEKTINDEKLRIKNEAAEKERKRIEGRVQVAYDAGMIFNGLGYIFQTMVGFIEGENAGESVVISPAELKQKTDEDFQCIIDKVLSLKKEDADLKAEADQQKKLEEDLLVKRKAEQDAKEQALKDKEARIKKEQDAKAAELKAEQDRIDAEKKAIADRKQKEEDEKKRKAEVEQAEKDAADKALKEKKEQEEKEAKEKAAAERIAKLEAELSEKMRPDNEKLETYAGTIRNLIDNAPIVQYDDSKRVLGEAIKHLKGACQKLGQVQS